MAEDKDKTPPAPDKDPSPPAPPPAGKRIKARVLVDTHIDGKPAKANDVVSLSERHAAALAGQVDTNPEAVKYAESLRQKPADDDALS